MKEEIIPLVSILSKDMQMCMLRLLETGAMDDKSVLDLLDLNLSSHMTSLVQLTKIITNKHPELQKRILKIIDGMIMFLCTSGMLDSVENVFVETTKDE
jgi:hypothetical protein